MPEQGALPLLKPPLPGARSGTLAASVLDTGSPAHLCLLQVSLGAGVEEVVLRAGHRGAPQPDAEHQHREDKAHGKEGHVRHVLAPARTTLQLQRSAHPLAAPLPPSFVRAFEL